MKPALPALAFACLAVSAHAEPGSTSGVTGPSVERGSTSIEARTAYFDGETLDGSWNHRAQAGHGFTDWWEASLILRGAQPEDDGPELNSVAIENVFDFTPTREWPVHLGSVFEYQAGLHGRDDQVTFKLLAEHKAGALTTRLNLNASHELSDEADWTPAYAARAMWRGSERFQLGLEAYGEPEVGAHYVGPRATIAFGDVTLALSYLAGFDDAQADGQFRLSLEIEP